MGKTITHSELRNLPVNLTVCKRGGSDKYLNGKIVVETDKAILVQFPENNVQVWLQKRNTYDNGSNYGCCAKLWLSYARVSVKPMTKELESIFEKINSNTHTITAVQNLSKMSDEKLLNLLSSASAELVKQIAAELESREAA